MSIDAPAAFNADAPAFRLGAHVPEWVHAQDSGAMALRCTREGCGFPVLPRVSYLVATGAVKDGDDLGAIVTPHLDEFLEWHQQEGRTL